MDRSRPAPQPAPPNRFRSFLPSNSTTALVRSNDRSMWVRTPEPAGFLQLLRSTQSQRPRGSSPVRGTRLAMPRRGRAWDTVLECVPARPVDVKIEVCASGERNMRARIRVVSSERVRLIVTRQTSAQKFYLQIDCESESESPESSAAAARSVELFIPSDFCGGIDLGRSHRKQRPCFSAGIRNRMRSGEVENSASSGVYLIGTERMLQGNGSEDEVRINAKPGAANVSIRMWDVERDAPESWTESWHRFRSFLRRVAGY
ncbi:hypothetical protein AURDEDRAFT_184482 [Auricularia subglabra TFB-10046 SS5]|nr:hypothetical protein AURDEDRAFT_184482 [Auricularia subglabra TFB-10046 SS5]